MIGSRYRHSTAYLSLQQNLIPFFLLSSYSWRIDWSGSSGFCKATLYHSKPGPRSFHYLNEGWEMFLPAPGEKGGPPFRASFEDCGVKCCNRELSRLVRLNLGQVEPVALKIIALIVTIHILEGQPRSIPVVSVVNPKCGSGLVSTLPGARTQCQLTARVRRRPWVTSFCPRLFGTAGFCSSGVQSEDESTASLPSVVRNVNTSYAFLS